MKNIDKIRYLVNNMLISLDKKDKEIVCELIRKLIEARKEMDSEVIHGCYDDILEEIVKCSYPEFFQSLSRFVKDIDFYYV